MATTQFSVNDPQTAKLYAGRVYQDIITGDGLINSMREAGIITKQEDASRSAGDSVTFSLLKNQEGIGLIGDETATGQESALTYFTDTVLLNQIRYPVSIPNKGTISSQRVAYSMYEDAYRGLINWLQERHVLSVFYQLAGFNPTSFTWGGQTYTGQKRLILQGLNSPLSPSSDRVVYGGTSNSSDDDVASDNTATFKLADIDELEYTAETKQPYIKPLTYADGIKYHLYVHTSIWEQLLQDTTSPIQYRDLFGNLMQSGKSAGTMARSFDYSQTRVFRSDKLPNGVSSTGEVLSNVRRSVFVGQEACVAALGQGYQDGADSVPGFIIRQETADIGQIIRLAINAIWGIKKIRFDGTDHGVITVSNYTAKTYQS